LISSSTLYAVAKNKKPCSLAPYVAAPRRLMTSTSRRARGAEERTPPACPSLRRERTTGTLL
jgi:hypothetical protein